MSLVRLGLVQGRHEITSDDGEKVTQFIFPNQINDPNDFRTMERHCYNFFNGIFLNERDEYDDNFVLEIYVTGLSQALTSSLIEVRQVIKEWDSMHSTTVFLMHFNRETGGYDRQIYI